MENLRGVEKVRFQERRRLRAAELASAFASALYSRGTYEIEKSSERLNFRQVQWRE